METRAGRLRQRRQRFYPIEIYRIITTLNNRLLQLVN